MCRFCSCTLLTSYIRLTSTRFALTADATKAKQIQDAAKEIDTAKAEAEKLREQLRQKEESLLILQGTNASLVTAMDEKERQLQAEEVALVSLRQELERHIYEDAIVDGDILRKFSYRRNFLSGGVFV